jgi:hypothetical protein
LRILILEVSCMDFSNHREGGMIFIRLSSFLLYRGCVSLEKQKSQGKVVEVTVNIARRKTL